MEKKILGFINVGDLGSSWASAATPEEAAAKAVEVAKQDWEFLRNRDSIQVHCFDISTVQGWYADSDGIFEEKTNDPLKWVTAITVRVEKPKASKKIGRTAKQKDQDLVLARMLGQLFHGK